MEAKHAEHSGRKHSPVTATESGKLLVFNEWQPEHHHSGRQKPEIKAWNKVTGVDCIMFTKYSTFYPSLLLPNALLNPGVASDLPWLIRCGKKDVCHLQAEALGASTCLPRLFFLWTSWLPVVRRQAAPSAWAPERRQCGTKAPPNHDGHTVWMRKKLCGY